MKIYEIEIELAGIEPRIWRKVILEESATLEMLHLTIQGAMGWMNYHLYEFEINGKVYDETRSRQPDLSKYLKAGTNFTYRYDMGDDWLHKLAVTDVRDHTRFDTYQKCLGGARACPPEDCGGIPGFQQLCLALRDETHEDHASAKEWTGAYDPDVFSPSQASALISALLALS